MPDRSAQSLLPSSNRNLILSLIVALATVALYNPATRAPFLNYDDNQYVVVNPHVRAGLHWDTVVWAFHTTELSDWKPLTWLSHALDAQLFSINPAGPHTVNILFHSANAVLLFLFLQTATGFTGRSLLVSFLFALHPINVESVAWIAERKNVLSMFFFLLALIAYERYARRRKVTSYAAATIAFALSLMSKAQTITFPFVLLLLDYWPLDRTVQAQGSNLGAVRNPRDTNGERNPAFSVAEKLPWFAMSIASAMITKRAEAGAYGLKLPLWARLANAAVAYIRYLEHAFFPRDLALIYPHPGTAIPLRLVALAALALAVITALAVVFRERRYFFVGWFWFLGTLIPMIGLIQIGVHSMADRYAYIPLIGIFLIAIWSAAELVHRLKIPSSVAAGCAVALLLTLSLALHRQLAFWSDNVTLWSHTLAITQNNYLAEDNLAGALIHDGRLDDAIPHLRRALAFEPDDAMAQLNIATYDQMQGNYQAAIDGFARMPECTDDPSLLAIARVSSGYARYSLQQYAAAQDDFDATLRQDPQNAAAYRGLGLLAQHADNFDQAISDYRRSIDLEPVPLTYLLMSRALEAEGHPDAAESARVQAARLAPHFNQDLATAKILLSN
jgi:protein O-mannosyl-transferase